MQHQCGGWIPDSGRLYKEVRDYDIYLLLDEDSCSLEVFRVHSVFFFTYILFVCWIIMYELLVP